MPWALASRAPPLPWTGLTEAPRPRPMQQLPLPVELRPESDFTDYLPGPNAEAVSALTNWAAGNGDAFIYLFGPTGTGKTHLLQAACRAAVLVPVRAVFLPLANPALDPTALEDLEHTAVVALDDVHAVAGDPVWERALFGLYNRLREADRRLLVSGQSPITGLKIQLQDLRSRLGWGPGYRLRPLDERECERLLRESANRRGFSLGREAISYIMRRCPRDARHLLRVLEELDRASLADKRRPTVRLIGELLTHMSSSPGA